MIVRFVKNTEGVEVQNGASITLNFKVGMRGAGVAIGGSIGQVLAKKSSTDFDTEWVDQQGGGTGDYYTIEQADNTFATITNLQSVANQVGTNTSDIAGLEDNKQDKTDNGLNTVNKTVVGAINEVNAIALGIPSGLVFATEVDMFTWVAIPANAATLKNGQNLYIIELNVPDYWWDFSAQLPRELEVKIDLTEYYNSTTVDNLLALKVDKETNKGLISNDIISRLTYNAAEDTISYTRVDGGTRELGKELSDNYTNLDTVPIVNGDIVSIVTATGNRSAVKLTDAANSALSLATIGMVTVSSISVNGNGEIAKQGKVKELNTATYTEGTKLYVHPTNKGKWTATKPTSGYIIYIGTVVVSHSTQGVIDLDVNVLPIGSDVLTARGNVQSDINTLYLLDNKEYQNRRGVTEIVDNFRSATAIQPSQRLAIASGTVVARGDGLQIVSCAAAANSGYRFDVLQGSMLNGMTQSMFNQFDAIGWVTAPTNILQRYGNFSPTLTEENRPMWCFKVSAGGAIVAQVGNGTAVTSNLSNGFTNMTVNTFYHLRIRPSTTQVVFEVFDTSTGALLASVTITTNIPTSFGSSNMLGAAMIDTVGTVKEIGRLQHLSAKLNNALGGALN